VLLENKAIGAAAVVKVDYEEKKIFIYVNGRQKRDYFSVIRHTLRDINAGFEKIDAVEKVPVPGYDDISIEYDELIGYEESGEEYYLVGKLKKRFSVKQLLNGIEKEEERMTKDRKVNSIHIGGSVGNFNFAVTEGDHSSVTISNIDQLDEKIGEIIQLLIEHNIKGKEEFIAQLRDPVVKKDRGKLREVFGRVFTAAANISSIYSAVAAIIPLL
jgi:hypothetical protein